MEHSAIPNRWQPAVCLIAVQGLFCLATSGVMSMAHAQYTADDPIIVSAQVIATGLDQNIGDVDQIFPSDLVPFPDDSDRLLVATLGGLLRIIDSERILQTLPYHDTTSALTINAENGNASFGMTTVAFHPDFSLIDAAGHGRFYTVEPELTQTNPPPDFPGIGSDQGGSNPAHDRVLHEYTVDDIAMNVFSGSKREVLRIHEHRRGHDVNDLAFDAQNYLLISLGDTVVSDSAQQLDNVFGSVLRIDPLAPADTPSSPDPVSVNGKYRIPQDNPYLSEPDALDEIYVHGLRNPFRISVDSTNQLWVSSNGNSQRESVYAANSGDNLGWPYYEGTRVNETPPSGFVYQPPVFEYDHGLGVSVTGVTAYQGSAIEALSNRVVFADLLGDKSARLFHGDAGTSVFSDILTEAGQTALPTVIISIGEDSAGELYLLGIDGSIVQLHSTSQGEDPIFNDGFESTPGLLADDSEEP